MGYLSEAQTIQARFNAEWDEETPVLWPGVHATIPDGVPWVRIRIAAGPVDQRSFGGTALYRHDGDVIVEIFTPEGQGERKLRELVDLAAGIFRGWRSGGIAFFDPFPTGPQETNGWLKMDVIAPFQRDETFTPAT